MRLKITLKRIVGEIININYSRYAKVKNIIKKGIKIPIEKIRGSQWISNYLKPIQIT